MIGVASKRRQLVAAIYAAADAKTAAALRARRYAVKPSVTNPSVFAHLAQRPGPRAAVSDQTAAFAHLLGLIR